MARKKEELTALKSTTTPTGKSGAVEILKGERGSLHSELESYEIDKLGNLLDKNRPFFPSLSTDSNATNCGARLYLSNNCAIDETFGSAISDLPALGGSSLVTYADHNRVVADNSLRLTNRLGQSFLDMDSEGNVVIKSSIDDGQQFLSLSASGITRLQARDKIELAVRSNNDPPDEAYVKLSVLKQIVNVMEAQILACAPAAAAGSTAAAAATTFAAGGTPTPKALEQAADAAAAAAVASTGSTPVDNLLSNLGSTKIFGE